MTEKQQNSKEEEEPQGKVQKGYELYVCNLPRSCEISDLVELFKPFATLISVEVWNLKYNQCNNYSIPSIFLAANYSF